MARPRVAVYIATSVDGFIAREDGSHDWLERVQAAGEDYGYGAFMDAVGALVLGRATWDTVVGFGEWPYAGKRVVVLTHRPLDASHGEEVHAGALAPLLDRLGAEGVGRVYLDVDGRRVAPEGCAEATAPWCEVDGVRLSLPPGQSLRLRFRVGATRSLTLWASGYYQPLDASGEPR